MLGQVSLQVWGRQLDYGEVERRGEEERGYDIWARESSVAGVISLVGTFWVWASIMVGAILWFQSEGREGEEFIRAREGWWAGVTKVWVWTQIEVLWWKQESNEGYSGVNRKSLARVLWKSWAGVRSLVWYVMVWTSSCDPIVYCKLGLYIIGRVEGRRGRRLEKQELEPGVSL